MAQAKKISDLNEKLSVDDNDLFVLVDSQAATYPKSKKLKASTLKAYTGGGGGGSNILIYDLAQFQSNANVVYPNGTIIYYKRGNGQITGVHKIADGVTQLKDLQMKVDDYIIQSDNYTHITASRCPFANVTNNYNNTGNWLGTTVAGLQKGTSTFASTNQSFINLFPLWYPMTVYGIGIPVSAVTTPGNVNFGIYTPNATYDVWSLVSGSATPDILISNAGYNIYTYPTPFTLDVGVYALLWNVAATTNITLYFVGGVSGTIKETNWIGLRYFPTTFVRTQTTAAAAYTSVPATINGQLNYAFDNIHFMFLLNKPAI